MLLLLFLLRVNEQQIRNGDCEWTLYTDFGCLFVGFSIAIHNLISDCGNVVAAVFIVLLCCCVHSALMFRMLGFFCALGPYNFCYHARMERITTCIMLMVSWSQQSTRDKDHQYHNIHLCVEINDKHCVLAWDMHAKFLCEKLQLLF